MYRTLKQKACRWHNYRRLVLHSMETKWHFHSSSAKLIRTTWANKSTASLPALLNFQEKSRVTVVASTAWGATKTVGFQTTTNFKCLRKVIIFNKLTFNRQKNCKAYPLNIKFLSCWKRRLIFDTFWNVRESIITQSSSIWNVEANPCIVSSNWNIRSKVSLVRHFKFNSFINWRVSNSTSWNVEHLNLKAGTFWKSQSSVSLTANVKFNVRLKVSKNSDTFWKIYRSLFAFRIARYKVFNTPVAIVSPRGIQRSGEFRGAYLASTTVKKLSQKQKALLGIRK